MKKQIIDAEPDAWISTIMCTGPEHGKHIYGKLPIQSLQHGYYSHQRLYSENTVINLIKAAYIEGVNSANHHATDGTTQ
jgi:hypothetical protein